MDRDGHLGALGPAHLLDRVHQGHVLGRQPFDLDDPVAGLDPGPVGRRALDRGDHGQLVVADRDLDPQAAEAARGLHLHLAVAFGVEEGRVRVERLEHAADRAVEDLARLRLVDVLVLDDRQDVGEELEVLVRGGGIDGLRGRRAAERQRQDRQDGGREECLREWGAGAHQTLLRPSTLTDVPRAARTRSGAAAAIARGPPAGPGSEPRSRAAAPPGTPSPRPARWPARLSPGRPPRPGSRRRARTACSTRLRDPG